MISAWDSKKMSPVARSELSTGRSTQFFNMWTPWWNWSRRDDVEPAQRLEVHHFDGDGSAVPVASELEVVDGTVREQLADEVVEVVLCYGVAVTGTKQSDKTRARGSNPRTVRSRSGRTRLSSELILVSSAGRISVPSL